MLTEIYNDVAFKFRCALICAYVYYLGVLSILKSTWLKLVVLKRKGNTIIDRDSAAIIRSLHNFKGPQNCKKGSIIK